MIEWLAHPIPMAEKYVKRTKVNVDGGEEGTITLKKAKDPLQQVQNCSEQSVSWYIVILMVMK